MENRTICLLGAGNIRCCPEVLAVLAEMRSDNPFCIQLFDANPERLDLMDRLARVMVAEQKEFITIRATDNLPEAIEGATDFVLMFNEDGSRRMFNDSRQEVREVENNEDVWLSRGDLNRPTPVSQLSPETRQLLSRPAPEPVSRKIAILSAVDQFVQHWNKAGKVISLMREIDVQFDSLSWPAPLSETELWQRPHQILRWIEQDDSTYELGKSVESSEFARLFLS